jgi:hypothetical protein
VKIDGKDVKDGTFELLPGLHKVNVDSDCRKAPVVVGVGAGGALAAAVIQREIDGWQTDGSAGLGRDGPSLWRLGAPRMATAPRFSTDPLGSLSWARAAPARREERSVHRTTS